MKLIVFMLLATLIGVASVRGQSVGQKLDGALKLGRLESFDPSILTTDKLNQLEKAVDDRLTRFDQAIQGLNPKEKLDAAKRLSFGFRTLKDAKQLGDPGPSRALPASALGPEALIGENNFLPISFLEVGVEKQRAVGRVAYNTTPPYDTGFGTAFFISDHYVMTNNHVIPSAQNAKLLKLQMNYQYTPMGGEGPVTTLEFDPDAGFYTNAGEFMDFTIVRVKPIADGTAESSDPRSPGQRFGTLRLTDPFIPAKGLPVNIIQHPDGRHKEVAMQDNKILDWKGTVLNYTTDTEGGSSGSPVFDNRWVLVGLHHAGGSEYNQAVAIDKIVEDIRNNAPLEIKEELGLVPTPTP